jgi:NAD binding domain of 6-phosphogluconate dehydrogenase
MAASLQRAGNTLTVYNRTPGKDEELVRAGAKRASRIAEACSGDAVITMLADDSALESAVYGEDGLLASLSEATLHISSSTISTELSERLARDHARAGQHFVSATVFGRPDVAVALRATAARIQRSGWKNARGAGRTKEWPPACRATALQGVEEAAGVVEWPAPRPAPPRCSWGSRGRDRAGQRLDRTLARCAGRRKRRKPLSGPESRTPGPTTVAPISAGNQATRAQFDTARGDAGGTRWWVLHRLPTIPG